MNTSKRKSMSRCQPSGARVVRAAAAVRTIALLGLLLFGVGGALPALVAPAAAGTIPTGPSPVDTVVHPNGATAYVLNAGNATVSVVNTATHAIVGMVNLGQAPNTCIDMDWSAATGRLLVGCSTGRILSVDPATSVVAVQINNPAASYGVICADNFVAGTLGWAVDANTGWLHRFVGGVVMPVLPIPMGSVTEIVEKRRTPGSPSALDAHLYLLGATGIATQVVDVNRTTLAGAGPLVIPAPNATPRGIDTSAGTKAYVVVNVAGLGRLYQLDLPTFTVSPTPAWAFATTVADVAVAGQFVLVLVQQAGAAGSDLEVFDAGDPANVLRAGRMPGTTGVNPLPGLASHVAAGATIDDIYALFVHQGGGGTSTSFAESIDAFVNAAPANVVPGLEPEIQAAPTGIFPDAPLYCVPCQEREATDAGGGVANAGPGGAGTAGSVQYATGEETYALPLFAVPGVGVDAEFKLTYRSRRQYDYRYGNGWFLNQDQRLFQQANNDERYYDGTGRRETYQFQGGSYLAPYQRDTTLATGSTGITISDRFGAASVFDVQGKRIQYADRFNNSLVMNWTGDQLASLTDALGRTYTVSHDATGRMSSITDFGGRTWTFTYDYLGQMRAVTTPATSQFPSGRTRHFSYSGNHVDARLRSNLIHVWSWKGAKVQTLTYNGDDLVTAEKLGDAAYAIAYDTTAGTRTVVDRSGDTTVWSLDGNANVTRVEQLTKGLRSGEPTAFVTQYTIGSNGYPARVVYPKGDRVDWTYDATFNVTELRHRATDTSVNSSSDIVTAFTYGAYAQVASVTDPRGYTTTRTLDALGNPTLVARPTVTSPATQTSATAMTWDGRGRPLTFTDAEARQVSLAYYTTGTQTGYLKQVTRDPGGLALATTFEYDAYGNITATVDPRGKRTELTVDAENFVTEAKVTAPFSFRTKFTYDANRSVTKTEYENVDRNGTADPTTPWIDTTATFDAYGRATAVTRRLTSGTTATTSFQYGGSGELTRVTSPEGRATAYEYDERKLLFRATAGFGTAIAATTRYDYDANGRLLTVTDPRGNAASYAYDAYGRTTRATNELGHHVDLTLDAAGNPTTVEASSATGTLLASATSTYDEVGRRWKVAASRFGTGLGTTTPTTIFTYDKSDRLIEVKDALLRTASRSYDAAGRLHAVTDAVGDQVVYAYDANGNVTQVDATHVPDGGGAAETFATAFVYDELNRLVQKQEIDRLNPSNVLTTAYAYDSRGNLTFLVDAEGHPTRFTYDLGGRLTRRERALATGTTVDDFVTKIEEVFAYDTAGRLTSLRDDNFQATAYTLDARDRVTGASTADGKSVAYTFDANGNVAGWTDQNGTVVANTYDARNRLVARAVTHGTGVQGTTSETYTYDALDRLLTATDDDYQVENTWDSVGNLLQQRQGYAASGQEKWKTFAYALDDVGAPTSTTYPSAFVVGYQRDALDRLKVLVDANASTNIATFLWQGVGRRQQTANQNGTSTAYAYDGFARVASIDHRLPGTAGSLHKFEYLYDRAHNRRMEQHTFNATWVATLPAAVQTFLNARAGKGDVFAYDWAYRLVDVRYDVANPATEVANPGSQTYATLVQYTLDGLGNRSQVATTPGGGTTTTVTYATDVVNQYTAVGGVARGHDANGNVADDGTRLYRYDYRNHLTEVRLKSTNALIATYAYDALGRRVEQAVAGGATTRYLEDGLEVAEEYDGNDVWRARYTYEDGIDTPRTMDRADVADVDGDGDTTEVLRFTYHQNALGSVTELTSPGGAVVEWTTYDVYGRATLHDRQGTVVAQSAVGNAIGFTGRWVDAATGLVDLRARTYDPATGRFCQRDPLGYTTSLSAYDYGASNPATLVDPLGLEPWLSGEVHLGSEAGSFAGFWEGKSGNDDIGMPLVIDLEGTDPRNLGATEFWVTTELTIEYVLNGTWTDQCGIDHDNLVQVLTLQDLVVHFAFDSPGALHNFPGTSAALGELLAAIYPVTRSAGGLTVGGVLGDVGVGLANGAMDFFGFIADALLNVFTLGFQYAATGEWFPTTNGINRAFAEAYTPESPSIYVIAVVAGEVATSSGFFAGVAAGSAPGVPVGRALAREIIEADRIGEALKPDTFHRGPTFLSESQIAAGRAFPVASGDGVTTRVLVQTTRSGINGQRGVFEYIYDRSTGSVSHQLFKRYGRITGKAN